MKIRRRHVPYAVAVAAVILAALPFTLVVTAGAAAEDTPTAQASVVKTENIEPPRRKVVHRKFRPWAKPSRRQVREIIRTEARRWRVSATGLSRRIGCESRYNWWASNGQYQGLLQFAPGTFYRGLRTIRSRRVKLRRSTIRRTHVARVTHYSDGRKVRRRTTPRRQRLVVVYTGRLPRNPSVAHAWTQVRIGAQALRGISAVRSSEWSCGA